MESSRLASCVSRANSRARSWSIETSAMISVSVRPPCGIPVRNEPDAPAWICTQLAFTPERTSIRSLNGARGSSTGESANSVPSPFGDQYSIAIPFGT